MFTSFVSALLLRRYHYLHMLHNLHSPNSNNFTIKVQGMCIPVFLLFLSSTDMSMHKVFVYGTLKKEEPNHHWIADTSKGFAKFLGVANTVEKYPLIIGPKYNIPFLLDARGRGNVSLKLHFDKDRIEYFYIFTHKKPKFVYTFFS